jgi:hypothetical protein
MSATAAPFGLRPSWHLTGGVIRPVATTITSTYGTNIFQGSPVGYIADGSIAMAAAGGTAVAGASGAFQGVEYTETGGRRRVSNFWPASTTATDIVAYITNDPNIVYEIQANGAVAQTAVGAQYDWSANGTSNGSTSTGISSVSLDTGAGAANAGLRVLGLAPYVDNVWGDAYTIVYVQLSEHQLVATVAQI